MSYDVCYMLPQSVSDGYSDALTAAALPCPLPRIPFPGVAQRGSNWRGDGLPVEERGNRRCFYATLPDGSRNWIFVDEDHWLPQFEVSGFSRPFEAANELVNGLPVFTARGGGKILRLKPEDASLVLLTTTGDAPRAYLMSDGVTWSGDGWWSLSISGGAVVATPEGTYRNDPQPTPPTVALKWPRWERDSDASGNSAAPFGVYAGRDGEDGNLVFGCEVYVDGGGNEWRETLDGELFVCRNRGLALSEEGGVWTAPCPDGSWYESQSGRPKRDGTTTLKPMKTGAGGTVVPDTGKETLVLSFSECGASGEFEVVAVGELALWR